MRACSVVLPSFLASLVAACATDGSTEDPPPGQQCCKQVGQQAACEGGVAWARVTWGGGTTSATLCRRDPDHVQLACASGCAVEGAVTTWASSFGEPLEVPWFGTAPEVMCADTPAARVGDACNATDQPCLPTRAELNPDGTVAGQTYLVCEGAGTCAAAAAPVVAGYLEACDAETLARHGTVGALGVVADPEQARAACLLAWDDAAQAMTSGVTVTCVGDWQCPELALCDDALPVLSTSDAPVAVCKPGPRGTLTPAMLAP